MIIESLHHYHDYEQYTTSQLWDCSHYPIYCLTPTVCIHLCKYNVYSVHTYIIVYVSSVYIFYNLPNSKGIHTQIPLRYINKKIKQINIKPPAVYM